MHTLSNEKRVLIIGVSSFQGEVYISRIGGINHWNILKCPYTEVFTFQGVHKAGFHCINSCGFM